MTQAHSYDLLAQNVADWIDEQSVTLADGFREHGRAPFSAGVSQRELAHYYEEQFFNPDGSENSLGHAQVKIDLGELNYFKTLAEIMQMRLDRQRHGPSGMMAEEGSDGG